MITIQRSVLLIIFDLFLFAIQTSWYIISMG